MNYKMMGRLIAQILLAEAAFMVPALIISLAGQDSQAILGIWRVKLFVFQKAKLSSAEKYREDSGGSLQRKQYCMYNIF